MQWLIVISTGSAWFLDKRGQSPSGEVPRSSGFAQLCSQLETAPAERPGAAPAREGGRRPHPNLRHRVLTPAMINTYWQEVWGNSHCWCPACIYSVDKDDSSSPRTIHLTSVMSTRNFFLHCCNKEQLYNWLQWKSDHPISAHTNKRSKREAMTSIYSPKFHRYSLQLESSSFKACPEFKIHSMCTEKNPTKP